MTAAAEIEAEFRDAAADRGLIIRDLVADGEIHRCDVTGGRSGKGDGAYLLHADGIPAGGFQNHRDGLGWSPWRADINQTLAPDARRKFREQLARKRQRRRAQREAEDARARARARYLGDADPAERSHPYLRRKQVDPHSTFVSARGDLMVPVHDVEGVLHGWQFIPPADGAKKLFMEGTRKKGHLFRIGWPEMFAAPTVIALAEGFATAASVFESTGIATVVAFDEGNLLPAAIALRSRYPAARLLFCADDDWKRVNQQTGEPENIGVISAYRAAEAVQGIVAG
jgi:putative DNA primase/helicase